MRKILTMLESYDTFENSFTDLTESLHSDEGTAPFPETIELQSHCSQPPRSIISPHSCRFHLEELEDTGSFFYDGSHYENDLVCLSGNSINCEQPSSSLDAAEQAPNFSPEDCSENEYFQPRFLEYFPASSSPCRAVGESGPEESNCAEATEDIKCEAEMHAQPNAENHFATKGKVNDLQRSALDAIFQITDRPSRVLVIYIASELRLHHVTVKNFFSNARRRVRRAAARLTDPERSKRENRKRKEKRRLAALSLAAGSRGTGASGHSLSVEKINQNLKPSPSFKMSVFQQYNAFGCDEAHLKTAEIVSPKRRALMEKLVDKVQRSAAQKILGSVSDSGPRTPSSTEQISVHVVPADSSEIWRTDTSPSYSNFPLPFSTTPRSNGDAFSSAFPLNVDSVPGSLDERTHTTDESIISRYTAVSETLSGDHTKRKDHPPPLHHSLLSVAMEYQPESWDVSPP